MRRIDFIKTLMLTPLVGKTMKLSALNRLSGLQNSSKMPVLFIGHGSPMNAIEENSFVTGIRKVGKEVQKPSAILCISAHWETKGTFVTAMESPRTIHDFGGFPKELYDVQYPAPGSPDLARETKRIVSQTDIGLDLNWGLDHGAWSVIKHLYPAADVPTIQLSIDYTKPAQYHFELAKELSSLRQKGVLIVGSGNMVHNLGLVAWEKLSGEPYAYDWAIEASEAMKSDILNENFQNLVEFKKRGKAFDLAIPTPEHFIPLLFALALKDKNDETSIFNDHPIGGSLSMTSIKFE
ncbi:MAG: 4,5-DOPA dioxygenase extradiol [Bacteroidia bacterium]